MISQNKLRLFVLFFALYAGAVAFPQTYDERLKSIQSQVLEKQRGLSSASNELDQLQLQLAQNARSLSDAKRNFEESVKNLSELKSKLSALNKQAEDLSEQHADHLSLLATSLHSMQHDARTRRLSYLLGADDWHSFERRAVYYDYFNRERENKLSKLSKQLSHLSDIRTALSTQSRFLELEQVRQQKILSDIEQKRQKKQQIINALEQKIAQGHSAIAALEKDAKELQRLIKQLGTSPASALQFNKLKGRLPWPLDGPINTRNDNEKLPGIFLPATINTEVKSIHDGHVVFSDWFRSYGMLLIIDHGDGYMSLYANNEALYKEVGDSVRSGERIAEVGNGGTSGDTGLYFEIRRFNEQLDPKLWCHRQNA